jgi:hypothetical protein
MEKKWTGDDYRVSLELSNELSEAVGRQGIGIGLNRRKDESPSPRAVALGIGRLVYGLALEEQFAAGQRFDEVSPRRIVEDILLTVADGARLETAEHENNYGLVEEEAK